MGVRRGGSRVAGKEEIIIPPEGENDIEEENVKKDMTVVHARGKNGQGRGAGTPPPYKPILEGQDLVDEKRNRYPLINTFC